jgi:hypothetical protein
MRYSARLLLAASLLLAAAAAVAAQRRCDPGCGFGAEGKVLRCACRHNREHCSDAAAALHADHDAFNAHACST